MATLNALKRAPILDQDGTQLINAKHFASTSDANIARVESDGHGLYSVVGVTAGTATITATRLVDTATATLEVTVSAPTPFTISLGAEVPA